ncbi:MAG TPA: hypothetical protein VF902_07405, partial [Coriobacteriia bacterium]
MTMKATFLGSAALAIAFAAPGVVSAQSAYTAKMKLPYEVHWGVAVLPAGEYTLALRSISQ